jgi:hypothetical protein
VIPRCKNPLAHARSYPSAGRGLRSPPDVIATHR